MECLLCKRKGEKTFNINWLCGDAEFTVKDDLTEFLGDGIEPHLKPEDVVCNICMNMLDDIAKTKRKLLDIILTPRENIYPIELGKSWNFFAKSAKVALNQFDESDFDEPITPSSLTPLSVTPYANRSTPSQIWSISHANDYIPELEANFARREMAKTRRSQSKASSVSRNDEEVAKLFRGRRRKERRVRSSGGLPKILTKKVRRVQSENDRSYSSLSNISFLSCSKPKKDFRPKTPKLYGKDKELIRPRTRSVSRLVFYCLDCLEDQKDMEMYSAHMVKFHNRKAGYKCLQCNIEYMTAEHLAMHEKTHDSVTMCTICAEKLSDIVALKKHTDQHFIYSVPCSYCDLSFLSEYEYHMHKFNHHKGRRRKHRDQKLHKIEQIVNYLDMDNDKTGNTEQKDNHFSTKEYSAVPMILDIREPPKFREPTFYELDFQLRLSEPFEKPEGRTSLGDDLVQCPRLSPHRSDSSSSISSDSHSDSSSSDSSPSSVSQRKRIKYFHRKERSTNKYKNSSPAGKLDSSSSDSSPSPVSHRKRVKYFHRKERSTSKDKTSTPGGKLDSLYVELKRSDFFNIEDRLSPQKGAAEVRNEPIPYDDGSDNSDIQTEMHYLDGKTLHTNVDLADIVNISSSGSSESNPPVNGVELDPDIGNN